MSPKTVTVFTKAKGCVMCTATHRALGKTDIAYTELDATDPEHREFGLSLGHMQAPVMVVRQNGAIIDHWSGFNPGKIEEIKNDPLIERQAPVEARELVAA